MTPRIAKAIEDGLYALQARIDAPKRRPLKAVEPSRITGTVAVITGSRRCNTLAAERAIAMAIDTLAVKGIHIDSIIHGGACGADQAAARFAIMHSMPVSSYPPQYSAHGAHAPHVRNREMINLAHVCIAIYAHGCWRTGGTATVAAHARRIGMLVYEAEVAHMSRVPISAITNVATTQPPRPVLKQRTLF